MFENFNKLVEEAKKHQAEKQKRLEQEEHERIDEEKLKPKPKTITKPIPFWREEHSRTTSSGVML